MTAGGRITDPVLGEIMVYREYKPMQDAIEYTTYFKRDGIKYRNDFVLDCDRFAALHDAPQPADDIVAQLIRDDIAAGNYHEVGKPAQEVNKMHESTPDDKWATQREDNDRRRDEADAEDANPLAPTQFADKLDQINESLLVLVSLTMRLYDLQLAMLTDSNLSRANEIYELHENKGHANPPVYIPVMTEKDEK